MGLQGVAVHALGRHQSNVAQEGVKLQEHLVAREAGTHLPNKYSWGIKALLPLAPVLGSLVFCIAAASRLPAPEEIEGL